LCQPIQIWFVGRVEVAKSLKNGVDGAFEIIATSDLLEIVDHERKPRLFQRHFPVAGEQSKPNLFHPISSITKDFPVLVKT
jgi:hypothetical protein